MKLLGKMDTARAILAEKIRAAAPRQRVTSVAELSRQAGDLATGPTVKVLGEAITEGLLHSTRGSTGGYWRTDKPAPVSTDADWDALRAALRQAQESLSIAWSLIPPSGPRLQHDIDPQTANHQTFAPLDDTTRAPAE